LADLAEAGLEPEEHAVSHLGMMNRITLQVARSS
jgi:hypothetical protein